MNRTKNTIRNFMWGILQKIVMIFLPFTTRTLLIKLLGADYLGLSGLFTSVLSLLSLAELGVSDAIVSSMYKPIAEHDTDTICALMAFYKKMYRIIGCIIFGVGTMFSPFLNKLINGDVPADINIYVLYFIYLTNTSVSYFLFAYKNCLFTAHQRNDKITSIQIIGSIIQYIFQSLILLTIHSYYLYAVVIPLISILKNLCIASLADKEYPEYICKGNLSKPVAHELKKRVLGLMVGKISGTMRSSIDSIFISMFLGLTTVAMYSNYLYIVTSIIGIIQLIESSMVAGVGNSIAVETTEKNYNDFNNFNFMLQWVVGWSAICILCLIQPFMKIWVGDKYMFGNDISIICAMYLFWSCIGLIRGIYTQALGLWWQLRYLSIIDIFVNIGLNYFLGKYFGVYGILAATIIDIAFVSIPWTTYFLFRDYFGMRKYRGYIKLYIKYFAIAAGVGIVTWKICNWFSFESSILTLIINAFVCLVVPNIFYVLLFRRNYYFRTIMNNLKVRVAK